MNNINILHEIVNELNLEIAKHIPDEYINSKYSFLKYESNGFDFNIKLFNTFLILEDYVDIIEININKENYKNDVRNIINQYLELIKGIQL